MQVVAEGEAPLTLGGGAIPGGERVAEVRDLAAQRRGPALGVGAVGGDGRGERGRRKPE